MSEYHAHIDPQSLHDDMDAYRHGNEAAGNRLATALQKPLQIEVEKYLGRDHGDIDDVVQDSIMATLGYLKHRRDFEGDLIRLSITIARNRCRDLHRWHSTKPATEITTMSDWLEDGSVSALDEIVSSERISLIQKALNAISSECRKLLHALYVAGLPTEDVRRLIGLSTVQGVYYRRTICLAEAKKFLQAQTDDRSRGGRVGGNCGTPRPER
jgi:RNA polymerase sigma factor (sigma-70 family)